MTPAATPRDLTPGLGLHRFRGDIQGLRAVAVLAVLVFHAGVTALPGGFVGVDVFFVISGFLITGLLLKEVDRTGRVALAEFYARRARRILPAALTVIALTVLTGLAVYPLSEWARLGSVAGASALSVVNWLFAAESTDYFAQEEAASPFQHYWSLAVEEQFYLVWPLLLVLITVGLAALRRRRPHDDGAPAPGARVRRAPSSPVAARRVLLASAVVGLASFAHSIAFSSSDPGAAYFVTTTRVWELALGAGLAAALVVLPVIPFAARAVLGWAGLAMIAVSLVAVTGAMPYPGTAALLPVVGSALVILAGAHEDGSTPWHPARLLATRPMQWVGDLSYSLYLVHWPVLTLAAWRFPEGRLPLWLGLLLALASVGLAWALRRWVEVPAMHGRVLAGRRRALVRGGLGMAVVAAGSALVLAAGALFGPARPGEDVRVAGAQAVVDGQDPLAVLEAGMRIVPDPAVAKEDRSPAHVAGCQLGYEDVEPEACEFGAPDADTVIAVLGDSHASQWTAPLEVLAEERGWRVVSHTKASCPVTAATVVRDDEPYAECAEWNRALPGAVERLEPDLVLVTAARRATADGESAPERMAEAWRALAPHTPRLAVLMDPPRAPESMPRCLEQHRDDPAACAYEKAEAMAESGTAVLQEAAALDPSWARIDLNHLICPGDRLCPPVVGEALVFFDTNHLTATFGRTLAPHLGREIEALLP